MNQEQKAWMISFSYPPQCINQIVNNSQISPVHWTTLKNEHKCKLELYTLWLVNFCESNSSWFGQFCGFIFFEAYLL